MAVAQDKRASELTAPVSIADTDVFAGYRPGTGGEPNLDIRATAALLRAPFVDGSKPVAAVLADPATGKVARTVQLKIADMLTVQDFGAVGDGTSHPVSEWLTGGARDRGFADLAAIQVVYPHVGSLTNEIDWAAAQKGIDVLSSAGGGRLNFPAVNVAAGQYYRLDGYPLLLRDYVTLSGDGPNSLIFNVKATSVTFMDQAVILPGNMHPEFMNSLTYDAASDVTAGDAILTLASTTRYSVGMTIVARTNDFTVASITDISVWLRFYRVISKTSTTLTLDAPIDETQTSIVVSPTNEQVNWRAIANHTRQKCYVCYRGRVQNLAIRSERFWCGDSAALETDFENVTITAEVGVYCNGMQRCSFNVTRGAFNRIAVELSMNSYATVVNDIAMAYVGDNSQNYQIMGVQERAKACRISCFTLNAAKWAQSASAIRIAGTGCTVGNGTLTIAGTGAAVSIDNSAGSNDDNKVEHIDIYHTNALGTLAQVSPSGSGTASRNKLRNIVGIVIGAAYASSWTAFKLGGTATIMRGCKSTDVNAQLQVVTGAADCVADGNEIDGGITYSDSGASLPRSNTVHANFSASSRRFRRVRYKQAGSVTDVTSTTANNAVISYTTLAATLLAGDRIDYEFFGTTGGTTADDGADSVAKEMRLTLAGITLGTLSMSSAEKGFWTLKGTIIIRNSTTVFATCYATKAGATVITEVTNATFGFTGGTNVIEFRAWLGAAGHIFIHDGMITPFRPGFVV